MSCRAERNGISERLISCREFCSRIYLRWGSSIQMERSSTEVREAEKKVDGCGRLPAATPKYSSF